MSQVFHLLVAELGLCTLHRGARYHSLRSWGTNFNRLFAFHWKVIALGRKRRKKYMLGFLNTFVKINDLVISHNLSFMHLPSDQQLTLSSILPSPLIGESTPLPYYSPLPSSFSVYIFSVSLIPLTSWILCLFFMSDVDWPWNIYSLKQDLPLVHWCLQCMLDISRTFPKHPHVLILVACDHVALYGEWGWLGQ